MFRKSLKLTADRLNLSDPGLTVPEGRHLGSRPGGVVGMCQNIAGHGSDRVARADDETVARASAATQIPDQDSLMRQVVDVTPGGML